jgi:hypothetical protein
MGKLAGLLVVLAIAAPGPRPVTAADKEAPPDYYPLKVGTKWHYRVKTDDAEAKQMINRIAKIEKIDGKLLALLETVADDKVVATEHLSTTAKGVFRHRFNEMEISPPLCLLKYPVKKGESWESETKFGDTKAKVTCRAGTEEIEVPAGKYKTVTVLVETLVDDTKISSTYWFAAGIGVVKQTADVGGKKLKMELEKVEKGKKAD